MRRFGPVNWSQYAGLPLAKFVARKSACGVSSLTRSKTEACGWSVDWVKYCSGLSFREKERRIATVKDILWNAIGHERVCGGIGIQRAMEEARIIVDEANGDLDLEQEWISRRIAPGELPLPYIIGKAWFWTLCLEVNDNVLIPRPCTETLVETALKTLRGAGIRYPFVVDVGTGPGTLLLSLLSEVPNAKGLGLDVSKAALQVAARNAASCSANERCEFAYADMLIKNSICNAVNAIKKNEKAALPIPECIDMLFCNPPYITTLEMQDLDDSVKLHEPHVALHGGSDGLDFYRALALRIDELESMGFLREGRSSVVLEVGHDQASKVCSIFSKKKCRVEKDLRGVNRCILVEI